MPHRILSVHEVATTLGIDHRSVQRLADAGELKSHKSGGQRVFRAADVSNWMAKNLAFMQAGTAVAGKIPAAADMLIRSAIRPATVTVPLHATSRASVLRELAQLAEKSGYITDPRGLLESLQEREQQHSTAFPQGVAIPHPTKIGKFVDEEPVIAACRLHHGIPFGDRTGTLTDLFFLVCCTNYPQHLMHLGRLCRVLAQPNILDELRDASGPDEFIAVLEREEGKLCTAAK